MSGGDLFVRKRWEGKSWAFKIKYLTANYPGIALSLYSMIIFLPPLLLYKLNSDCVERLNAMRKFRQKYIVMRPDDPDIERVLKQKKLGKNLFPEY